MNYTSLLDVEKIHQLAMGFSPFLENIFSAVSPSKLIVDEINFNAPQLNDWRELYRVLENFKIPFFKYSFDRKTDIYLYLLKRISSLHQKHGLLDPLAALPESTIFFLPPKDFSCDVTTSNGEVPFSHILKKNQKLMGICKEIFSGRWSANSSEVIKDIADHLKFFHSSYAPPSSLEEYLDLATKEWDNFLGHAQRNLASPPAF